MRTIYPETVTPEYHAAGVALCKRIARAFRHLRDDPKVAYILMEGPRPANLLDPHDGTESEAAKSVPPQRKRRKATPQD